MGNEILAPEILAFLIMFIINSRTLIISLHSFCLINKWCACTFGPVYREKRDALGHIAIGIVSIYDPKRWSGNNYPWPALLLSEHDDKQLQIINKLFMQKCKAFEEKNTLQVEFLTQIMYRGFYRGTVCNRAAAETPALKTQEGKSIARF